MFKAVKNKFQDRVFRLKFISYMLMAAAVVLFIYLVFLPYYPGWKYALVDKKQMPASQSRDLEAVRHKVTQVKKEMQTEKGSGNKETGQKEPVKAPENKAGNRVIIPKIGVNAPIVEAETAEAGLARGAWRLPESSTPPEGGNTVITGHRFKYLPPNNLTFYLFHELKSGDIASIIWQGKEYYYRIQKTKVVPKTQVSITDPTEEPRLTLFTCHPIFSQKERLVVIGELVDGS